MHRVTGAEALPGYRIRVRFADGLEGTVDLSDLVGNGVFEQWNDPVAFTRVYVDPVTHTIAWPGGIDLCPDSLHQDILEKQKAA